MDNNLTPKDIRELERKFNLIPDHFTPYYFEGRLDAIARLTNKKERVLKHGKGKCPPDKGWVQPKGRKGFCRTLPEVKALQQASLKMGEGQPMTRPKSQFPTGLIIGGAGGLALGAAIALTLSGSKSRDDVSKEAYESVQQDLDKERIKARDAQARRKEIEEKMAENEAERINLENEKAKAQATAKTLEKQLKDLKAKQQKAKEAQESATTSDEVDELKKAHAKEKQDIENKVKSGEKKINELETELNAHKGKVSNLEEQLAEKLKNHERLVTLKETLAEAVGFKEPTTVPIENVTKRVKKQLGEIDKLTQERDKVIAEKEQLVEEMKKSSEKEGEIEQEIRNAEGELKEETQNLTELKQKIKELEENKETFENAKSGLEENLNTIKQTLKNANISEDILDAKKINPEELQRELAKLSTPPDTTGIEQGEYDKAIAELTKLKEAQLAIAKKLYDIDENASEGEARKEIGEIEGGKPESLNLVKLAEDGLESLKIQATNYEGLKAEIRKMAKVHLGEDIKETKSAINEALSKLNAKLKSGADTPEKQEELQRLQALERTAEGAFFYFNNEADKLRIPASDEVKTRMGMVLKLAEQAQKLQGQVNILEESIAKQKEDFDKLNQSLLTSQQTVGKLTNDKDSLTVQRDAEIEKVRVSSANLQEANNTIRQKNQEIEGLQRQLQEQGVNKEAIEQLKQRLREEYDTQLKDEANERLELEKKMVLNFDRQMLRKPDNEQRQLQLDGAILASPDEGISLVASKGWGSKFHDKTPNEQQRKIAEACSNVVDQAYIVAQGDLQKQMIRDLQMQLENPDDQTLRFFTPLTANLNLQGFESNDIATLHSLYSQIRGGIGVSKASNESIESITTNLKARLSEKKERGQQSLEERDSAYRSLERVEYAHQVLKLREKALIAGRNALEEAYSNAHKEMLKNTDLNNPDSLRQFDARSRALTKTLNDHMIKITESLLDENKLKSVVREASEYGTYTTSGIDGITFELNDMKSEEQRNKAQQNYLQFDFLRSMGIDRDEIAKLFPSMIASSNQKKNK